MDILTLIREKNSFLLSGHEHPDGDCLGAQVALHHLLQALGKQSTILNPDPLTRQHEFLTRHTPFHAYRNGQALLAFDVLVLLDCCQLSRLSELGKALATVKPLIAVIDHHVGSDQGDGVVCYVDPLAPSSGALVHELYGKLGVPLSPAAAEGVFLSLVADTGWFRYSNTDPRVLRVAAELVESGVDPSGLYDQLFRRNHQDTVALLSATLAKHEFRLAGKLVCATIDKATMDHSARAGFDTDLVLEPLRSVEGVEVVALAKERHDGAFKVSMRASGDVDVQAIAKRLGGGGHKKAAGATVHKSAEQIFAFIESQVRDALGAILPPPGGGRGR